MNQPKLHIISKLYDASVNPNFLPETLDGMADHIGAKSSALLMLETLGEYNYSINKLSSLFNQSSELAKIYEEKYSHHESEHFANVSKSPAGIIIKDFDYIKDSEKFRNRPDVAYLEDQFGIYERFAVRLNQEKAWFDCITFQYANDRGNISNCELEI